LLRSRLLSALIIVSAALVFVALDAWVPIQVPATEAGTVVTCVGFWMIPLGAYLIYGSAVECVTMCGGHPRQSIAAPALIGCAGVMLAAAVPVYWPLFGEPYPADCPLGRLGWPMAASAIALLGCFVWYIPSYQANSGFFLRAILAGWVSVYFGGCFAFAIALRLTGTPGWGLFLLVGIIVVTKFADSGAYFCGKAWGRTKLCPHVSPGKSVEGLVGGMLVAIFVAWVYFGWCAAALFQTPVTANPWRIALLGLLLTLAGLAGDLLESIFKREMGCKDSGRLLPGLGGLWDVTDSLLPAAVVGYLAVVMELVRGPGQ
jgi:phosphatidate cytidylyltransferase